MEKTNTQKKKKRLAKECGNLWKYACHKKWGGECIICGHSDQTTFHHYIPKSRSLSLRYDIMNGVPLCNMKCHYKIHHSGTPDEVREICDTIRKKRGKEWCEYIDNAKKQDNTGLNTIAWLEEQKAKLNDYLEE